MTNWNSGYTDITISDISIFNCNYVKTECMKSEG